VPDDGGSPAPASGKFHCVLCLSQAVAAILPEPEIWLPARAATASVFVTAHAEIILAPVPARSGPSRAPPPTV
jgi:hypothetical protein